MARARCVAVLLLVWSALAPPSATLASDTPTCFGRPATIVGTPGKDFLEGTKGPDVIVAGAGRDGVQGRGGNDRICLGKGPAGRRSSGETVSGGAGDDLISGGPGPDLIFASHSSGDDVVRGGPGKDSLSEWYGNDILIGGSGNDDLYTAGPGSDLILGRSGRDVISSDAGNDDLRGGPGEDTVDYGDVSGKDGSGGSSAIAMFVDLADGRAFSRKSQPRGAFLREDPDRDRLSGIENVTTGGGPDVIRGNARDNVIVGNFGRNQLRGRGGDDKVYLSEGRAWGGAGDDLMSTRMRFLDGGPGFDMVTGWLERYELYPLHLDLQRGTLKAAGTRGTVTGLEGAYGSIRGDTLRGDAGDNVFFGGSGSDELDGRGGRDELNGGRGNDTCRRGEVVYECGD